MSAVRREKGIEDIIAETKSELKILQTSQKNPQDVKLNYIRSVNESATVTDSVTTNPNKAPITETASPSDSVAATMAERFELEAVDGLHANEAVIKIEFWEIFS